jgi:Pregnancy-associated plasma protein-A
VTVPVWFHVISPDGVEGNVSQAVIDDQMREFNEDFAGGEGGLATGFTFRLVGVTRTTNADWFGLKDTADEQKMKKALRVGGAETLNVYLTSGAGFLGWAYFPSTYHSREYIDGIVMDHRSLPGGPYGERFSLGETLTHGAGHLLGLYHTFQGGCNDKGDYVDDTPAMLVPTSGCPAGKDTCPKKPGLDPIHNYMDYSWDSCYSEFTPDQAARMQDQWLAFRAGQ